jgi:hypothetical protein
VAVCRSGVLLSDLPFVKPQSRARAKKEKRNRSAGFFSFLYLFFILQIFGTALDF